MHPTPPRLAARPLVRFERRVVAPFVTISRVETRALALATCVAFAVVGAVAALVAVFHLGDLMELGTVGRTVAIVAVVGWMLAVDAVEPLGLRIRDLAGSLTGELDTHRPVAAAALSVVRAVLFLVAAMGVVLAARWATPFAGVIGLLGVALLASQAESVARRRAWALGDAPPARPMSRQVGRDEELVHAVTGGDPQDLEPGRHRATRR